MKKIFSLIGAVMLGLMALVSCSPDTFDSPNGNVPVAANYADNVTITVDEETNFVYFQFQSAPGVTPLWIIDGTYSSDFTFKKFYRKAGTYTAECKVKNKNGISEDAIPLTFVVTKSIMTGFAGFDVDSEYNLFKTASVKQVPGYYAPGWSQIADPEVVPGTGNDFTVKLPAATTDQWQAQVPFETTVSTVADDETYDFSVILTSTLDHPGVTVKFTNPTDDNDFYFAERVALKAGEPHCFYMTEMPSRDIQNLKLFFDFGGCAEGTEVMVENLVFIPHSKNEIEAPEEEVSTVEWRENDNLLKGHTFEVSTYYAHGDSWEGLPEYQHSYINGIHQLSLPTASNNQWQCQYTLNNYGVQLSAAKKYDYRVKIMSSGDIDGVTIKLTQQDNDDVFILQTRVPVKAYQEKTFEFAELEGKDISNLKIVYDFGGNPDNCDITISDELLQEHIELTWDASASNNMWKGANAVETWSMPGWASEMEFKYKPAQNGFVATIPSDCNGQWQAQFKIWGDVPTQAGKRYDLSVVLNPSADVENVTVKWVEKGHDDIFYSDAQHNIVAYEDNRISLIGVDGLDMSALGLVLDFGFAKGQTEIEIKDIIVRESGL